MTHWPLALLVDVLPEIERSSLPQATRVAGGWHLMEHASCALLQRE